MISNVAPDATETTFDEFRAVELPSCKVPALTATLPANAVLLVMLSNRTDVELFWTTCVTFAPNWLWIIAVCVPLPEFVIVPVLLTSVVSRNVLLPVPVLVSFRTILPVPVTPPVRPTEPPPLAVRVRLLLSVTAPPNTAF